MNFAMVVLNGALVGWCGNEVRQWTLPLQPRWWTWPQPPRVEPEPGKPQPDPWKPQPEPWYWGVVSLVGGVVGGVLYSRYFSAGNVELASHAVATSIGAGLGAVVSLSFLRLAASR